VVKLLTSLVFRSLGKSEVPEDCKSLKRGETSLFNNLVEKFEVGDVLVTSLSVNEEFNHLLFKNVFLLHLL
jgi:hypothetical protein